MNLPPYLYRFIIISSHYRAMERMLRPFKKCWKKKKLHPYFLQDIIFINREKTSIWSNSTLSQDFYLDLASICSMMSRTVNYIDFILHWWLVLNLHLKTSLIWKWKAVRHMTSLDENQGPPFPSAGNTAAVQAIEGAQSGINEI